MEENKRKQEIFVFKLKFPKFFVDKGFRRWYYIQALKKRALLVAHIIGGLDYVNIYGKTCRSTAQVVHR